MSSREALSEHDEQFIQRQLDTGRYRDRNDVIHAGLQMLAEFEGGLEDWLRDEIPARYTELKKDASKAVSFDSARARFEQKHRAALSKAK